MWQDDLTLSRKQEYTKNKTQTQASFDPVAVIEYADMCVWQLMRLDSSRQERTRDRTTAQMQKYFVVNLIHDVV